jgi:hypothetical protein
LPFLLCVHLLHIVTLLRKTNMFKKIKEKIKAWFSKIKEKIGCWSGWDKAGSVFMARMAALFGGLTALIGAMDFSPFWALFTSGTEFTPRQLIFMGIGIFGYAVSAEIVRRRNTKDF